MLHIYMSDKIVKYIVPGKKEFQLNAKLIC